jgi:hypothetical protein
MAIQLPNFAPIAPGGMGEFDLGRAIHSGLENYNKFLDVKHKPKALAEALLAQQLQNKIQGINAQYAEPMAQSKLALTKASIQRALRGPQPVLSNLEKAIAGTQRIKQQFGENSPEAKAADAYVQKISQGSGGISVGVDPDTGMPLVQIGGGARGQGNNGSKLFQTESGEVLSQPTGASATNLQGRVTGAETVKPYIEEIIKTLPQFQELQNLGKTYAKGLSNAVFKTNYKEPSELASGKAALKEASEGLIKTFGLNATGANRVAMEDILAPHFGESAQGYTERVTNQLEAFMKNKKYAEKSLRRGISVGNPKGEANKNIMTYNPITGRLE